jgi:hypothetical protein
MNMIKQWSSLWTVIKLLAVLAIGAFVLCGAEVLNAVHVFRNRLGAVVSQSMPTGFDIATLVFIITFFALVLRSPGRYSRRLAE